jgi:hypothetical protein
MKTDSFVLTFSPISTALFPCFVMSTVGDISLINGAMCQWNTDIADGMDEGGFFLWICFAKAVGNGFISAGLEVNFSS